MLPQTILLFVVALFLLAIVVSGMRAVRQKWRRRLPDPPLNVDFSVADLKAMLDKGQLAPEEFERAREIVLQRAQQRDVEADRSRGHGFQVIQSPPPLPPLGPPAGGDVGGASSRDAR